MSLVHVTSVLFVGNQVFGVGQAIFCKKKRNVILLDYANVIYDQRSNANFSNKIEAALAITGCSRGTSKEKLYQ